ncbi:hypothetical protein FVA77_09250 [Phyllobacterium endophyticum]|nr:hypothetical protein FVA77_09250 [Phyllobacterium endophyticum]
MSTSARTIRFRSKLGLKLERRTRVEGEWTGRATGLRDQRGGNCRDAIAGDSPASSCRLPSRISRSDVASVAAVGGGGIRLACLTPESVAGLLYDDGT